MALNAKYAEATASWQTGGRPTIGIKNVLEVSSKIFIGDFVWFIGKLFEFNDIIKASY